jgi:adenylate cyclase
VSFSDVLEGRVDESRLRDRVVVVGPVAPSLQDVHATATSGDEFMSGAEIQANAIWTALRGFPLRSTPEALTLGLIALFGLLPPLAGMRLSLRYVLLVSVLAAAGFLVLAQVAFERGRVLTVAYPFAALVLSSIGSVGAHYTVAAFDRARVRDVFGRFVPEQVVDEVLAQVGGDLRLGGRTLDATVMFTDIRGFTSFSEDREADEVIDVINRFLEGMTSAVLGHGGTLVSFTGDGFMAVFGAPIEQPDHADRALEAARDMRDRELPSFNAWLSERGLGDGFRLGIGLNSGAIMAGNVGSQRRLEYTVMGDVVNVASRVEGLTKGTPHMLLLTETTRGALVRPPDDLVYVDEAEVRGRHAKIGIWSVDGSAPGAHAS